MLISALLGLGMDAANRLEAATLASSFGRPARSEGGANSGRMRARRLLTCRRTRRRGACAMRGASTRRRYRASRARQRGRASPTRRARRSRRTRRTAHTPTTRRAQATRRMSTA
eukprot:1814567-Pleurochrysis_carterae.AAC.1